MTDRYTRRDAEAAFEQLALALGKPTPHNTGRPAWTSAVHTSPDGRQQIRRTAAEVGMWSLDYSPTYGGCIVTEIVNDAGGATHPIGYARISPREFCDAVRFALDALDIALGDRPDTTEIARRVNEHRDGNDDDFADWVAAWSGADIARNVAPGKDA